jgi:hypothetical protein
MNKLLTEELFGRRCYIIAPGLKIQALISKNTSHAHVYPTGYREEEYRITWFNRDKTEAKGHSAFDKKSLDYILRTGELPKKVKNDIIEYLGFNVTKRVYDESEISIEFDETIKLSEIKSIIKELITEILPGGFALIIGIISMDGIDIEAVYGNPQTSHKSLTMKKGYCWRYNELSDILYWRQNVPSDKHREKVIDWLEDKGYKVRNEIDLDNLPPEEYNEMWQDAHGR